MTNRKATRTYAIVATAALAALIGLGAMWGMSSARVQQIMTALVTSTPPTLVSYQGVVEVDGSPYDGSGDFVFKLFDAASGGTELWTESQTGLAVADGVFQTNLGVTTPLTADLFDGSERWLEVTFGSDVLSPRQRITSVPYALRANVADSATSVTLGEDPTVCDTTTEGTLRYKDRKLEICDGTNWHAVAMTAPPPDDIVIYDSGETLGWTIGGRSGADARCAAAPARPDGYPNVHALLSIDGNDEIRDFPALYGLPLDRIITSTNGTQIAANWADLLDGNIAVPLSNAGVLPSSVYWWSGSNSVGWLNANCNGFAWSNSSGMSGFSNSTNGSWMASINRNCASLGHMLCIGY